MSLLAPVVLVGTVVVAGSWLARRLRISAGLVLFAAGSALGFIPALHGVELAPELVLSLFLPALLYWEASTTSIREIRDNLRVVVLLAVGLVVATAVVVGAIAAWLGLPWPVAFLLGTVLAPTDATAVSSATRALPRRTAATLRAESLFNDAAALALYGVAVGAVTAGAVPDPGRITLQFLWASIVGLGLGIGAGWVSVALRSRLRGRSLTGTVGVLAPLAAFLAAEVIGGSGVVAAVLCGLTVAQRSPRLLTPAARQQAYGFWQITSFGLTGALFVLTGLQLHKVVAAWPKEHLTIPMTIALATSVVLAVILTRFIWFNSVPYLLRLVDRRQVQRQRRSPFRQRLPLAWAGMRGAVSLAAALALPMMADDGSPFPNRSLIIGLTFVVIATTISILGPTFPAVVRFARFPADDGPSTERRLAFTTIYAKALDELPAIAADVGAPDRATDAIRVELEEMRDRQSSDAPSMVARDDLYWNAVLRKRLIEVERSALLELRSTRSIDDDVARSVQSHLDAKELALSTDDEIDDPS